MIELKSNPLYKLVIRANHINFADRLTLSQFNYYMGSKPFGMKSKVGYTIEIDLRKSEDELMQDCKSNTRNEIRRAIREEFFFEEETSIDAFVQFYNDFAKEKGIDEITRSHITQYGDNVKLYKSGKNGVTMTMHASAIDSDSKCAILLYSASVRFSDSIDRKDIGFSNRYLHFKEFIQFKELGLETYDFNGISIDPEDKERYSISQFKAGFGGEQKEVLWLFSYPFCIMNSLRSILQH